MLKKFYLCLSVLGVILMLNGCHSTAWYQDRAVKRAKTYLLERSKDLKQSEIDFIRFNDPVLLRSRIYSGAEDGGMTVGLGSNLSQICVTWQIPDTPEVIMVYGISNDRMEDWYPERIIRKTFVSHKQEFASAITTARDYAVSNLQKSLTAAQLNNIRFTAPSICQTNFPTASDPQVKLTADEQKKAQKAQKNALQVSLVWPKEPGTVVLFCGYSEAGFTTWQINFAGIITEAELSKHTVKKLRTPADALKPVTGEEIALFPAIESKKEAK